MTFVDFPRYEYQGSVDNSPISCRSTFLFFVFYIKRYWLAANNVDTYQKASYSPPLIWVHHVHIWSQIKDLGAERVKIYNWQK